MSAQPPKGFDIAVHTIVKCIAPLDNEPGQPQCVDIVGKVAHKAEVSRHQARYLISLAVGKFNAVGLAALFEDSAE
jgi:hypothetical protein